VPDSHVEQTGAKARYVADLEWTFPLDMVEVIWGDGKVAHRTIVDTRGMAPFGRHRFDIPFDAGRARWARLAAWDSAGNGAMTQPVAIGGGQ
jgi:hypothetical protein